MKTKSNWIEFIQLFSKDSNEIDVAIIYKELLKKNIDIPIVKTLNRSNKFYLYGPNSSELPNLKLKESTLILTKDPLFSVSQFKNIIGLL